MVSIRPIMSTDYKNNKFAVLNEQIYGYKHGIRPFVLQTMQVEDRDAIEKRLQRDNLNYHLQETPDGNNLNVFFGDKMLLNLLAKHLYTNFLRKKILFLALC